MGYTGEVDEQLRRPVGRVRVGAVLVGRREGHHAELIVRVRRNRVVLDHHRGALERGVARVAKLGDPAGYDSVDAAVVVPAGKDEAVEAVDAAWRLGAHGLCGDVALQGEVDQALGAG